MTDEERDPIRLEGYEITDDGRIVLAEPPKIRKCTREDVDRLTTAVTFDFRCCAPDTAHWAQGARCRHTKMARDALTEIALGCVDCVDPASAIGAMNWDTDAAERVYRIIAPPGIPHRGALAAILLREALVNNAMVAATYLLDRGADPLAGVPPFPACALELAVSCGPMAYPTYAWFMAALKAVDRRRYATPEFDRVLERACTAKSLDAILYMASVSCVDAGAWIDAVRGAALLGDSAVFNALVRRTGIKLDPDGLLLGVCTVLTRQPAQPPDTEKRYDLIAGTLLEMGADVDRVNDGDPILATACGGPCAFAVAKVLLDCGARIARCGNGASLLRRALSRGALATISLLSRYGAVADETGPESTLAGDVLRAAVRIARMRTSWCPSCAECELARPDTGSYDPDVCSLVRIACDLAERGANLKEPPGTWCSPMHAICLLNCGHAVTEDFIAHGADVRAPSLAGFRPLRTAIQHCEQASSTAELLLDGGASLYDVDPDLISARKLEMSWEKFRKKYEAPSVKMAAKAFATGRQQRLGADSPIALLNGFDWIIEYISKMAVPDVRGRGEPELR
jgi:hypothetical protein